MNVKSKLLSQLPKWNFSNKNMQYFSLMHVPHCIFIFSQMRRFSLIVTPCESIFLSFVYSVNTKYICYAYPCPDSLKQWYKFHENKTSFGKRFLRQGALCIIVGGNPIRKDCIATAFALCIIVGSNPVSGKTALLLHLLYALLCVAILCQERLHCCYICFKY